MKEITSEDWQKNSTPRMMWVWDIIEENKEKRLVVHCFTSANACNKFIAEDEGGRTVTYWKHCAEIEEPQFRRMTNQELAWWFRDHPEEHREWRLKAGVSIFFEYAYSDKNANEPCGDVLIRSNGGEWHEPLVEVEE